MRFSTALMVVGGRTRRVAGKQTLLLAFTGALAVGIGGCQMRKATPSPTEAQLNHVTHTVRAQGETLFAIAAWYTGQGLNWKLLVDANPGLNPNRMRIGETIHIPRKLVKRVDAMPLPSSGGSKRVKSNDMDDSAAESRLTAESPVEKVNSDGASSDERSKTEGTDEQASSQVSSSGSSSSIEVIRSVEDILDDKAPVASKGTGAIATPLPIITAPSATVPTVNTVPPVEKRTKSRAELLQELLKDY